MFSLIPRETAFFELLDSAAHNALKAARVLRDLLEDPASMQTCFEAIREREHEGDGLAHDFLDLLDRTFVVPLEREDLYALIRAIDDVVDTIDLVADNATLYKISEPTPYAVSMGRLLVRACEAIDGAIPLLRSRRRFHEIDSFCIEINRLENLADAVVREGLMKLFEAPTDAAAVFKGKEFYQVLETAMDHTENVADCLRGIAIKGI
ncbi:MAG: DUF47 family protein [Cyanobacteria bacterium REEB65]|nr:DUF47 family protein [Cyanobacteria bacterium REEB65]